MAEDIGDNFLAWLAGFWEGEGWLDVRLDMKHVNLGVAQSNPKPIKLIHSKLGGGVYVQERNNRKPAWTWRVCSRKRVKEIVLQIIPFLKFRGGEISEKLEKIEKLDEESYRYKPAEDEIIRENWQKMTDLEIAQKLNRTRISIQDRRKRLRLVNRRRFWTPEEIDFIKQNFTLITDSDIAREIKRSSKSVRWKREELGLLKRNGSSGKWIFPKKQPRRVRAKANPSRLMR